MEPITHVLKTWVEPFTAVWEGRKTAEFRKNDRGFKVGDELDLMEYDHESGRLTGREIEAIVTHTVEGPRFGIPEGYCMLSIRPTRGLDQGIAWEWWEGPPKVHLDTMAL